MVAVDIAILEQHGILVDDFLHSTSGQFACQSL